MHACMCMRSPGGLMKLTFFFYFFISIEFTLLFAFLFRFITVLDAVHYYLCHFLRKFILLYAFHFDFYYYY